MPQSWFTMKKPSADHAQIGIEGDIGAWGISARDFRRDLTALGEVKTIDLIIHSRGGDVLEGLAIYNMLNEHPATITARIGGLAASMATVIALAADKVTMPANAWWMMHEPRGGASGTEAEVRRQADMIGRIRDQMVAIYAKQSGLAESVVRELLAAETWLTGTQAKEKGFVDEVSGEEALAACADLDLFDHVPDEARAALTAATSAPGAVAATAASDQGALAASAEDLATAAAALVRSVEALESVIQQPPAGPGTAKEVIMTGTTTGAATLTAEQENAVRARALADEKKRRDDVRAVFAPFPDQHAELLGTCLEDSACSADDAGKKLLAAIGKNSEPTNKDVRISTANDPIQARFMAHAENAIAVRAQLEPKLIDGNGLRSYTLMELARIMLERRGVSLAAMDKMAIIAAAFTHTSSDFPKVLANTANKAMMKGYMEAAETFPLWTSKGTLPDFKTADIVDLTAFASLGVVREGAEFKYATIGERREQMALATYGAIFSITRQAIINDDLRAFSRVPAKMGAAAKRTVGDLAYAVLTANAAMADTVALFHSTHANLAGSGGAISTTTVDAGRAAMGVQTLNGAYLNIRPAFLLCPVAKEGLAIQTISSEFEVSGSKNLTAPNPVRNIAKVVSDARLTSTPWYLVADPNTHDTVEVAYLDGNESPTLEQQDGWNVDGVEFKVRIDAAAKALDHRTMYKDPGA
jgi:ATP-dependent protease ClpP protease subunit